MESTVAWYKQILKLDVSFSNEWFVEFSLNEKAKLSIANEAKASIKSSRGKGITISLNVDDITDKHLSLIEAGLNPSSIKTIWHSKAFYIYDPEGNRIEFWSKI